MPKSIDLLKRIFRPLNLMRTAFAIAALFTAWTIFRVEERWRGERQWNQYRAQATSLGVKQPWMNIVPPDVPDSENFAAIPSIKQLFAEHKPGNPDAMWFSKMKLDELKVSFADKPDGKSPLERWSDALVERGVVQAAPGGPAETVLSALKVVDPEIEELREAGKRPRSKFPVSWEKGFGALLPHLGPMQASAKVFRISMVAHLTIGDSNAALNDFRDGFRIYLAMREEPVLISALVRISILRSIEEGAVKSGALSKWSDEDLQRLDAIVAPVNLEKDLEFAVESERAILNSVLDDLMGKSNRELTIMGKALAVDSSGAAIYLYPRGWFRLSQVRMNQYFDKMLASPWPMKTEGPKDPLLNPDTSQLAKLPYWLFVVAAPAVDSCLTTYASTRAQHDQVRIAFALERFRRKNGDFPTELAALVPGVLPSIPPDPIDGAPMRYLRTDDGGFKLWSVGVNRTDDGGTMDSAKSVRQQPDWVLQVSGKP